MCHSLWLWKQSRRVYQSESIELKNEFWPQSFLFTQDITSDLPFHRISLDGLEENDAIDQDLQGYILHRIHSSPEIQNNISLNGKMDNTTFGKLSGHLKALSQGSYLYLKLTFDLIEKGYLVLKSSSYKVKISKIKVIEDCPSFPLKCPLQKALLAGNGAIKM